jgi:uncharacterized protein (TIGR02246 family)
MLATVARCCTSLGLALLVAIQSFQGMAETARQCSKPSAETVTQLFDRWNAALATGNADAVARLYADDAVLLSALSDRVVVGRDQIRTHFSQFLALHPQASVTTRAIDTDCATAVDSGTYVYRVTGRRKGTRMLISGRYAIRYEFRKGDWHIISHRASGAYLPLSSLEDLRMTEMSNRSDPSSGGVAASSTARAR